jgi:hypothetical protein
MTAILAGIGVAFKKVFVWLVTNVVGKVVLKKLVMVALMALFLMALAGADALPKSPLAYSNDFLTTLTAAVPYTRYIATFVPVVPIVGIMGQWILAITAFHVIKVMLRMGNIIK